MININRGWKLQKIIIIKIDVPEIRHNTKEKTYARIKTTKYIHSTEISEPFSFADIFHLFIRSVVHSFFRLTRLSLPLHCVHCIFLSVLWALAFHKKSLWISLRSNVDHIPNIVAMFMKDTIELCHFMFIKCDGPSYFCCDFRSGSLCAAPHALSMYRHFTSFDVIISTTLCHILASQWQNACNNSLNCLQQIPFTHSLKTKPK